MVNDTHLDLTGDPVSLTAALVDIPSPSHHERAIADVIEKALTDQAASARAGGPAAVEVFTIPQQCFGANPPESAESRHPRGSY